MDSCFIYAREETRDTASESETAIDGLRAPSFSLDFWALLFAYVMLPNKVRQGSTLRPWGAPWCPENNLGFREGPTPMPNRTDPTSDFWLTMAGGGSKTSKPLSLRRKTPEDKLQRSPTNLGPAGLQISRYQHGLWPFGRRLSNVDSRPKAKGVYFIYYNVVQTDLLLFQNERELIRAIIRNKSDTRVEISQDWLEEAAAGCILQLTAH